MYICVCVCITTFWISPLSFYSIASPIALNDSYVLKITPPPKLGSILNLSYSLIFFI